MKWASAIGTPARLEDAVEEAAETVEAGLGGAPADLVTCFVAPEYADHYTRLLPAVQERFSSASSIIGCSAGGVIGGGVEIEHRPALSITAASLPGVKLRPFHLGSDRPSWDAFFRPQISEQPHVIVLADPFTFPVADFLAFIDELYPAGVKVGGLASGGRAPGTNLLIANDVARAGAVGVTLSGNVAIDTVVAQGCRPIGNPMFATRTEDHIILELDGQSAAQALEALHAGLPERDRQLFEHSLFLGLVMNDRQQVYDHGDFLIRDLIGIDPAQGSVAVAGPVRPNQVVQFHLRDADTSTQDLRALLRLRRELPQPAGALLFSCMGRGQLLYGRENHDSDLLREHLGPVPLGGFFGNGEIGPVRGRTFVHGYTSAFALFRPR